LLSGCRAGGSHSRTSKLSGSQNEGQNTDGQVPDAGCRRQEMFDSAQSYEENDEGV